MQLNLVFLAGLLGGLVVGVMGFIVGVLAGEREVAQTFGGWGTVIGGSAGLIAGAIIGHGKNDA